MLPVDCPVDWPAEDWEPVVVSVGCSPEEVELPSLPDGTPVVDVAEPSEVGFEPVVAEVVAEAVVAAATGPVVTGPVVACPVVTGPVVAGPVVVSAIIISILKSSKEISSREPQDPLSLIAQ